MKLDYHLLYSLLSSYINVFFPLRYFFALNREASSLGFCLPSQVFSLLMC